MKSFSAQLKARGAGAKVSVGFCLRTAPQVTTGYQKGELPSSPPGKKQSRGPCIISSLQPDYGPCFHCNISGDVCYVHKYGFVSSLAAFISYAVECFGQWKAHHYSVYAESSNTKMKESVSRKKNPLQDQKVTITII